MTQENLMVQEVQNFEQLQGLKVKELQTLANQFKAEDTDCLPTIKSTSKKGELIKALAEHMGFNQDIEPEIVQQVNKELEEAVNEIEQTDMQDVMDFGEDTPSLEVTQPEADPFVPQPLAGWEPEETTPVETPEEITPVSTGDTEVDSVLAELGLDGLDELSPEEIKNQEEPEMTLAEAETIIEEHQEKTKGKGRKKKEKPVDWVEGWGVYGPQEAKKEKAKRVTLPMDAPIPVRQYENLLLGIYGNILEEKEEPFPAGHKYEGCKYEEIKLERFNSKAHEVFRTTKGHMHLVYTNTGSTYLIVMKKPDGGLDPILEVSNKGRGHLRCKQIANFLQVAYNEKKDQEIISGELYIELATKIELMPINMENLGA